MLTYVTILITRKQELFSMLFLYTLKSTEEENLRGSVGGGWLIVNF